LPDDTDIHPVERRTSVSHLFLDNQEIGYLDLSNQGELVRAVIHDAGQGVRRKLVGPRC